MTIDNLDMEKEISLEALDSHKIEIESDSIPSGIPEDYNDSNNIDIVPEEENKADPVEENQDEDNKGAVFLLHFIN